MGDQPFVGCWLVFYFYFLHPIHSRQDSLYGGSALCWVLAAFNFFHPIQSRQDSLDGGSALCWALTAFLFFFIIYKVGRIPWTGDQPFVGCWLVFYLFFHPIHSRQDSLDGGSALCWALAAFFFSSYTQ
jgi:hypothetical protein